MDYITLNAHKKCIGQSNFDSLLYINNNGQEEHTYYLNDPGTYTIKYVSGAILSFGYTYLNSILPLSAQIDENHLYWNRFYRTNLMSLGRYDASYFPESTIIMGCFQCQFGTLPGFTDTGYYTSGLADTFNRLYLSNPKGKYNYTDQLQFTILEPTKLVFWYTDSFEQSVEGSITYSIDNQIISDSLYYLNDLSVLSLNKKNKEKISYTNYSYTKYKENFTRNLNQKLEEIWLLNTQNRMMVEAIHNFNTIGYSSAYLNYITYSDTLNYEKVYSDDYHWELIKNSDSPYKFIGRFDYASPNLLLYMGNYTIFLATQNDNYVFSKFSLNEKYEKDSQYYELLDYDDLDGKLSYSFFVEKYGIINFNKLLINVTQRKSITEVPAVYIYAGIVDLDELQFYITESRKNYEFITAQNSEKFQQYFSLEPHKVTSVYNNITYNYYIDASLYIEDPTLSTFIIYSLNTAVNNYSFGPYTTSGNAIDSLFELFNLDPLKFKIIENDVKNTSLIYTVMPKTND